MTGNTMKAIRIHDYGGPEVLQLEEVDRPNLQAGQALIKVHTSGVNPADWKVRQGLFKQFMPLTFPWVPGLEGAGVVEAIAADVTNIKVGEAVFGPFSGSYAEYAMAAAKDLFRKPASLSYEEAAGVPVGALTAWSAVIDTAQVQAGQRVLVHGAAGGVGLYALQLAKWKGAYVIGTASTGNVQLVRSLGADEVIDYKKTDFESALRDLDAVIDTVGGDLHQRSIKVIRKGGIFVTVAGRVDAEIGKAQGVRATNAGRSSAERLGEVIQLIESGKLKPVVGKVFNLSEARQAHELSQTGHGAGRIILRMG